MADYPVTFNPTTPNSSGGDLHEYMQSIQRDQRMAQDERVNQMMIDNGLDSTGKEIPGWTPTKPPPPPVVPSLPMRSVEDLWLGVRESAAGAMHLGSNVYNLLDTSANKVSQLTGLPKNNAAATVVNFLKDATIRTQPTEKDFESRDHFVDYLFRAIGAAPITIGEYAIGSAVTGNPIAGMALIEALRASDKGLWETIKGGIKGALFGTALKVVQPLSRPVRSVVTGAGFGGLAAVSGAGPAESVAQAVVGLGLGAMGPSNKKTKPTEAKPTEAKPVEAKASETEVKPLQDLTTEGKPDPVSLKMQEEIASANIEAEYFIRQKGLGALLEKSKRQTTDPAIKASIDRSQKILVDEAANGPIEQQLSEPTTAKTFGLTVPAEILKSQKGEISIGKEPTSSTDAGYKPDPNSELIQQVWQHKMQEYGQEIRKAAGEEGITPQNIITAAKVAESIPELKLKAKFTSVSLANRQLYEQNAAKAAAEMKTREGDLSAWLSKQKEAYLKSEAGFSTFDINFAIARTLGGAAYGFSQGDTIQDRLKNALLYGTIGGLANPKMVKVIYDTFKKQDPKGIKEVELRDQGFTPTVSKSFDPSKIDVNKMSEFLNMTNEGIEITGRVEGINYDHINTPMDVKYTTAKMAKVFKPQLDKLRKVEGVTHEQQIKAAERLAETKAGQPERLMTWPDGKPMTDPELLLTRMLYTDVGKSWHEASLKYKANPSPENLASFVNNFNRYSMFQDVVAGQATGRGRSTEALKIDVGNGGEVEFHKMLGDVVQSIDPTGWTPERLAEAVSQIPNIETLNKAVEIAKRPGMYDMLLEAFYGVDMLSNPKTLVVNAISSPVALTWQVAKRSLQAGFTVAQGKLGDPNYTQPVEPLMMMQAIKDGYHDAFVQAHKAATTGERMYPYSYGGKQSLARPAANTYENYKALYPKTFDAAESALGAMGVDAQKLKYGIDLLGSATRMTTRLMLGTDEFNEFVGSRMELYALAAREASATGRNLSEIRDMTRAKASNMDNFSNAQKEAAKTFALYNTFNQEPGSITTGITGVFERMRKSPDIDPIWYLATKAVVPFITIPANIARWTTRESGLPGVLLSRRIKEDMAAGGARAQSAWAGVALGSMVLTLAANMAMNGYLNGAAPAQKADRLVWEADGNIEYSFKFPFGSFGINRIDPVATPFAWAADGVNILGHKDAYDVSTLLGTLVFTMVHNLASKNYVQNATNFLHAITSGDMKEINQLLKGEAGSLLVPGIVRAVRQETDPYRRAASDSLDVARAQTPWGSTDYPPVLDRFARPVYSGYGASQGWVRLFGIINPIQYRAPNENRVIQEITKNNIPIPGLSDTIFGAKDDPYDTKPADSRTGIKLEGWEYYLYNKYAGEQLFKMLSDKIDTYEWQKATGGPDGGKAMIFGRMDVASKEYARKKLLDKLPELKGQMYGQQVKRKEALRPTTNQGVGGIVVP